MIYRLFHTSTTNLKRINKTNNKRKKNKPTKSGFFTTESVCIACLIRSKGQKPFSICWRHTLYLPNAAQIKVQRKKKNNTIELQTSPNIRRRCEGRALLRCAWLRNCHNLSLFISPAGSSFVRRTCLISIPNEIFDTGTL